MILIEFNNYKAVLFDLDGVIYNTEPLRFKSYQIFFGKKCGKKIPDKLFEKMVGHSQYRNFKYLLKYLNIGKYNFSTFKIERQEILIGIIEKYVTEDNSLIQLLDNLIKFGFKIGLVSNSATEYIDFVLKKLKIDKYFQIVISGVDYETFKPDPLLYTIAIKMLRENKKHVIAIEDSPPGVIAAENAGLICLGIKRSYTTLSSINKSLIFNSLNQINTKLVQQLT